MRRLALIILCILAAFAAASLAVYRAGISRTTPEQVSPRRTIAPEVKTAEGEVQAIDVDGGTLTILDGDHEFTFTFDDRTSILQSGHTVAPDSIEAGAGAKVRYLKRAGKNWARRIDIMAPTNGSE